MGAVDVLVIGGGPSGSALASACSSRGLDTALLDPAPDRPWKATYGMWSRELPADLPASVVAARAAGRAIALTEHQLGWDYAVLDVPALQAHLADGLTGVRILKGRAVGSPARGVIELADGTLLRSAVIVDAGGRWRPLGSSPSRRTPAEQTAYGMVLDADAAAPLLTAGDALFMDWRADHGETGWPTFLYAIPLGGGQVLVEETSLARRPGFPMSALRHRLHARLSHHGIRAPENVATEKVWFPVDQTRHRGTGSVGFGAAAPLIHPATGYSLAASLRLAPVVAETLATHLPAGADAALAAARKAVWPRQAQVVHGFRRIGLEALLRMSPEDVPGFFEQFFALPDAHRWTYLTARDDLAGIMSAMNCLFRQSRGPLRRHLVTSALRRPLTSNDTLART